MSYDHVSFSSRLARLGTPRLFAALSLLAFTMLGGLGACDGEAAAPCAGGFINAEGVCEGKCTPDKCLDGNTCVGNRCVLKCTSHTDCLEDASQNCVPSVEDDTGAEIMTCQLNGTGAGTGTQCAFGDECDGIFSCKTTGERCNPTQCGGAADACTLDEEACYAKANCNIGKCPDKSPCTVFSCAPQDCVSNLVCLTKGEGDTDAYCAKRDCKADSDCPGGYYCGAVREAAEICNSDPQKGNNNICGKVSINTPCIEPSTFNETLYEGQLCALRNTCLKRDECAPCDSDLDCTGLANHCITMPGESQKRCARECAVSKDCGTDFACQDVAGAGSVCVHKFGACVGTGKFCEPCLDDTDCGPLDGTSVCYTHGDGQRGCADLSFPVSCTSDADCPKSPSGLNALCFLDDPTASIYQKCYIAVVNAVDKYTCW